jgi:hypothetical protein
VLAGGEQGVLGPLLPERLLAQGESQSAAFLVTYVNAIDPLEQVLDGFLVHGRGTSGAALDGFRLIRDADQDVDMESIRKSQAPEQVRSDARVPVLVLQSETDVVSLGGGRADQDDGERIRLWEVAGAAHADSYLLVAAGQDSGALSPAELARHLNTTALPAPMATGAPINSGPQQHYVGQAALRQLERWVTDGIAPPAAGRLQLDGDGLARDEAGNALGGIRTPWVDVPLAVLTGLGQAGDGFAFLFGRTAPFDAATRSRLYPGGKSDYLARFGAALQNSIDAGFLLEDDRAEIEALAAASWPA